MSVTLFIKVAYERDHRDRPLRLGLPEIRLPADLFADVREGKACDAHRSHDRLGSHVEQRHRVE